MSCLLIFINSKFHNSHSKIQFIFDHKGITQYLRIFIILLVMLRVFINTSGSVLAQPLTKTSNNAWVWAGTSNAGVWLFENNNWTQLSNGLGNVGVHSLQINPFDHNILIAITANGVYRTEDSGLNWLSVNMPFTQAGWKVVYWDRANQGDVVISGPDLGEVFNTDPRAAVSHDAGLNWIGIDLDIGPGNGLTAEARPGDIWGFLGHWYMMGNSFHNIQLGWPYHRRAFWRSNDRGNTWELLGSWPREQWDVDRHVTGLWDDPTHIFGTFDHSYANPIIESTDAGDTWIKGSQYLHTQRQILNDPVRLDTLWLIAQGELYVSSTGASGFQKSYSLGKDMRAVAVDGYQGIVFAAGNNRRMAYSIDGGTNWINADLPITGPVTNDTHILSLAADQPSVSTKLVITDIEPQDKYYISCTGDRTVTFKITIKDENGNPVSSARATGYDALISDYYTTDGYSNINGELFYITAAAYTTIPGSYTITFKAIKPGYQDSEMEIRQVVVLPAIPEPNDVGENYQHINLWRDIEVQNAQTILCPFTNGPGEGQRIVIIEEDFGLNEKGEPVHGTWAAQVAAGLANGQGPGYNIGDLPGIAAGAFLLPIRYWDYYMSNYDISYTSGCLVWNKTCGTVGWAFIRAFEAAIQKTGYDGVIAFPIISWRFPPPKKSIKEKRDYLGVINAIDFLLRVKYYVENGGVVVLPSNFFAYDIASNIAVKELLRSSGALVAHAIKRGSVPLDECKPDDFYCATSREEVNIAVPTTINNNSLAVPSVAAVAILMKNANNGLTSKNIRNLLTNKTGIFKTVQINGTNNNVGVLNAYEAVKAAMNFNK